MCPPCAVSLSDTETVLPENRITIKAIDDVDSHENAKEVIGRFIHFYNYRRPHMSIGYKIPAVVHLENGPQKKMWKKRNYPKRMNENQNNGISLPCRTTGTDDGCGHNI